MKTNKRGVSSVVATVLIIMIVVAAIGILWTAVVPMVRNSIDKGSACFDALSDITLVTDKGYTCCYTDDNGSCNGTISVQVAKAANEKISLAGIQVIVSKGGTTSSIILNSTDELPGNNEEKVYVKTDETNFANADAVNIAPIVTIGQTEESCDPIGEVQLSPCT